MAFSFVDRISEFEPGKRARGYFEVPRDLAHIPPSLIAEAVGQLAGWVAMEKSRFQSRPVAALAAEVTMKAPTEPGSLIELAVEVENCEADAVAYGGWARRNGTELIELAGCVGPMLPMEEFDDPGAVRKRFEALCAPSGCVIGFDRSALISLQPRVKHSEFGARLLAEFQVPERAAFFTEHFPRKPVFPGTLLLDAQIRYAGLLALQVLLPEYGVVVLSKKVPSATPFSPRRVRNVKVKAFMLPGELLELESRVRSKRTGAVEIDLAARRAGRLICTSLVEFVSEGAS